MTAVLRKLWQKSMLNSNDIQKALEIIKKLSLKYPKKMLTLQTKSDFGEIDY